MATPILIPGFITNWHVSLFLDEMWMIHQVFPQIAPHKNREKLSRATSTLNTLRKVASSPFFKFFLGTAINLYTHWTPIISITMTNTSQKKGSAITHVHACVPISINFQGKIVKSSTSYCLKCNYLSNNVWQVNVSVSSFKNTEAFQSSFSSQNK